jgi:hypothetical protein
MTMSLVRKRKITTTLTPHQVTMLQAISAKTRIPQAELVREAVDSLIQKYQGTVSEDFASLVDDYLEERRTLMERLAR